MKFLRLFLLFGIIFSSISCSRPHVQWTSYSPEVMTAARHSGKPVIADFYAAWCGPCMEMKDQTFTDPRVIEALEPFVRVRVDMSYNYSAKVQKIADEFDVNGLPTMILFDSQGKIQQRLTGFVSADQLLKIIKDFKIRFHIVSVPSPATGKAN